MRCVFAFARRGEQETRGADGFRTRGIPQFAFACPRLAPTLAPLVLALRSLAQDLRLYTAFKTEMQHCRQQSLRPPQIAFRKTSPEWEIYGDLALRLHHPEEAREAYQLSLEQRFSSKALLRLVDMWSLEGMIVETLECAGRLAAAWEKGYGVPCVGSTTGAEGRCG